MVKSYPAFVFTVWQIVGVPNNLIFFLYDLFFKVQYIT
jgi:hypothetical protein